MKFDFTFPVWNIIVGGVFVASVLYKLGGIQTKVDAMWDVFMGDALHKRRAGD